MTEPATNPSHRGGKVSATGHNERLASAKICRCAAANQFGRLTDAEALAEIGGVLTDHHITGDRVGIVLADAASAFVDNPLRTGGLAVLVAAGADVELARQIRAEAPGPRPAG